MSLPPRRIHCQFALIEVTRIRMYVPLKEPNEKGEKWTYAPGVRVKLSPVQGEPFGSATPGGQLEMVIANPEAAQVFYDAPIDQKFDVVLTERRDETEA